MTQAQRRGERFGRFSLTGAFGAALQLLLFDLLMKRFHLREAAAAAVAVELVVLNNFYWHERFTWADRGVASLGQRAERLWRFHATNGLISLAGNALLVHFLVGRLKAPALPSAVAAIAACAPANFLLADRWVYRKSSG
jgi:putative flippase GtrA